MIRIAANTLLALCLVLPAAAKDRYEGIHTIAVVAALGDVYFTDDKTPFHDSPDWILSIADWKLDDAANTKIAKLLASRFAVKDVAYEHVNFAEHKRRRAILSIFDESEPTFVKNLVLKLPPGNGVDAYIVVRPVWFAGDYISMSGLAVSRFWNDEKAYIHAHYIIEVVDAKTGETIADSVGHIGDGLFDDTNSMRAARYGKHWAPDRKHFTAEHAANVRGAMLWLLDYSLPFTLYSLELGPKPDPDVPFGHDPTPAPPDEAPPP
jgi:hypothetical protein